MKFDLHCHTKEGSLDSKVSVREYADRFLAMGYDGFMIADHNSYKGCRAWDLIKGEPQYQNLTVIRGIEYDTKDAGHVLIIMPDDLYLRIFRIRGMRLAKLIKLVHGFGGILGLAHPFGVASSSAMGFKQMNHDLIHKLDFIETFNTCESALSNSLAKELALRTGLPTFAGSDSHVTDYIGMACTEIEATITCNNDLITAIQAINRAGGIAPEAAKHTISAAEEHLSANMRATAPNPPASSSAPAIRAFGIEREETKKSRRKEHWTGIWGFKLYNRGIGKLVCPYRKLHHRRLHHRKRFTETS